MEKVKVGQGVMNKSHNGGVVKSEFLNRVTNGGVKTEKLKSLMLEWIKAENQKSFTSSHSPLSWLKLWAVVATIMMVLLMCALLLEFTEFSDIVRPRLLTLRSSYQGLFGPPERIYETNGYLMVSSNGGLNQMRAGISDMVAIARYLNAGPANVFMSLKRILKLEETKDYNIEFECKDSIYEANQFEDIFDVDYFIQSLRDEVKILKELPQELKKRVETRYLYSMPPVSWSNMSYYNTILPLIRKHHVLHFTKTDARIANNGIPEEMQKLRCRVNYKALRFTPQIEQVGKKIVKILKQKGPFLVLHLRYEMDMLAFSGCYEGCNETEMEELTKMRYAYPWWKEKEIDSQIKRMVGLCPLTPEETVLTLKALDIDPEMQIYIAAGDIYGGERRMAPLRKAFPNLVKKESLLDPSDLEPFPSHSNRMAALDYIVSLESNIFIPTYSGNMAKVVEGHRRYMGFKTTIIPNRFVLVRLIDQYKNGRLSWEEFSKVVKAVHARRGGPTTRLVVPRKPKIEDYFYSNPQECLPQMEQKSSNNS